MLEYYSKDAIFDGEENF